MSDEWSEADCMEVNEFDDEGPVGDPCPECNGTGNTWEGWPCEYCDGTGWIDP